MDCQQTNNLLSHYFDGELPADQRIEVESHIKDCADCLQCLAFFAELSEAIRKLSAPEIPREMLWQRITAELDGASENPTHPTLSNGRPDLKHRFRWGLLATVALVLIAFGLSWMVLTPEGHHEPLQSYADLLGTSPEIAQEHLAEQYSGRIVSPDEAVQLVGYRPRNVEPPPAEFTCDKVVVLDMPGCKCVQAVWQRSDGSHLAIFERKSQTDEWFADQPSIHIECEGTRCRVTQVGSQLAASWQVGSRVMTVIGVRNTNELAKLVAALS